MRSSSLFFFIKNITFLFKIKIPIRFCIVLVSDILKRNSFKKKKVWPFLITLFLTGLGFIWIDYRLHQFEKQILPDALDGQRIWVQGEIISIPQVSHHKTTFLFHVDHLVNDKANFNSRTIFLSEYQNSNNNTTINNKMSLSEGQIWQFLVYLKKPHVNQNQGQFLPWSWYYENNIVATGYIVLNNKNNLMGYNSVNFFERIRQTINNDLDLLLKDNPYKGFIKALIIGVKSDISEQQWQVLSITGTNHLMAVAGLHLGFLYESVFLLTTYIAKRLPELFYFFPYKFFAIFFAMAASFIYAKLSGFLLPAQRAFLMIFFFSVAQLSLRPTRKFSALLFSFILILIVEPLSIYTKSFWMSFLSVLLINFAVLFYENRSYIFKLYVVQLILTLGLLPLALIFFNHVSIGSILANIIAIPWLGFIIIPLIFLLFMALQFSYLFSHLLLKIIVFQFDCLWKLLFFLSKIKYLLFVSSYPHIYPIIYYEIGLIILLIPIKKLFRIFGFFCLLPILFFSYPRPHYGQFYFYLLDVGQGLASVIETKTHTIIYDTGPRSIDFDSGTRIIQPFLLSQGIKKIDLMMVSHGDNDHSGGATSLLENFQIDSILSSVPAFFSFSPNTSIQKCQTGQFWQWDGIKFEVLYPDQQSPFTGNNNSCVMRVCVQQNCVLLTGDIESPAEYRLLDESSTLLNAQLLVAPHHGSITSSTPQLIEAVQPHFVLFPVGYDNRFNFPSAEILSRYQNINATIIRTDQNGEIFFAVDQKSITRYH